MKKSSYRSLSEINVTNLVDVTLVILIIFMITAPLLRRGFEISLPKAEAENIQSREHIMVSLVKTGELYINSNRVKSELFDTELARLYQTSGKPPVLLQADREIPYGRVIGLMDRIKKAGIDKIGMVVEPGKEP
jgi:biopolymer transport protein TolR